MFLHCTPKRSRSRSLILLSIFGVIHGTLRDHWMKVGTAFPTKALHQSTASKKYQRDDGEPVPLPFSGRSFNWSAATGQVAIHLILRFHWYTGNVAE
eukprot:gene9678-biopygen3139